MEPIEIRKILGLSQAEFADLLHLKRIQVAHAERHIRPFPSKAIEKIIIIAEILENYVPTDSVVAPVQLSQKKKWLSYQNRADFLSKQLEAHHKKRMDCETCCYVFEQIQAQKLLDVQDIVYLGFELLHRKAKMWLSKEKHQHLGLMEAELNGLNALTAAMKAFF